METKFHTLKKVAVTLKIWSRSPKSNQLVPPSQQCICASLDKISPSVQKITRGNEAMRTQTPTGSAPKTICPPPFGLGDIINSNKITDTITDAKLVLVDYYIHGVQRKGISVDNFFVFLRLLFFALLLLFVT